MMKIYETADVEDKEATINARVKKTRKNKNTILRRQAKPAE
jgi:hypothetical protein